MTGPGGEIVVYRAPDGRPRVQLRSADGTVRLAQAEIATLYGISVQNIAQIAKRVLDDGEVTGATINFGLRDAEDGRRQDERDVLSGPGRVSVERMKVEVGDLYLAWDERRRAREADQAAVEEADDLRELLAVERPPDKYDES